MQTHEPSECITRPALRRHDERSFVGASVSR
jgi:hypothetical protein